MPFYLIWLILDNKYSEEISETVQHLHILKGSQKCIPLIFFSTPSPSSLDKLSEIDVFIVKVSSAIIEHFSCILGIYYQ